MSEQHNLKDKLIATIQTMSSKSTNLLTHNS